ncbi:MDS1 and EVI1 complex locus protein EVI1 [Clonorchis sinensis]|uniref:MDS1 and EVI1 complex locus protein EVI1 n=1 Tax=Clonorchis sinensis TaxID=79923 RepID=G7YJB1_CLOSI|nr:MDS1 and EVI1 complex locus protein EVI1 [Clonorchis sinensis]
MRRHEVQHFSANTPMFTKHECTICGKAFTFLSDLKAHALSHTGPKTYECETCGRKFGRYGDLHKHKNCRYSLSVRRELPCEVCRKPFTDSSSLETHMLSHFVGMFSGNECPLCKKQFSFSNALKRHFSLHSKVRFVLLQMGWTATAEFDQL